MEEECEFCATLGNGVLWTLGIAWENENEHINELKMPRNEWKNVNFVRD
jgi:hypothetical protein